MLLTGIVAGAAAVYFLKTPKGKQMIDLMLEKGEELNEQLAEHTTNAMEKSKVIVEKTVKEGEALLSSASQSFAEVGKNIKDTVEDTLNDFDKGVEQARTKLKNA